MRVKNWIVGIITLSILGIFGASWWIHVSQANSDQKITVVGSTALQPLAEQAAYNYQKQNTAVAITVQGGGSGTGLSQVQERAVAIGNSDVFASQQAGVKADQLTDHQVAVVGIAPVVNRQSGVSNLTMQELRAVFTGKITNWRQVGGRDQKITVVNRAQGSGTRLTFEQAVLNGQTAVQSQEQDSNGTVQKIVSATPGAISYLAFSYINGDLQPLRIDGVAPVTKNVVNNRWKIWSYEHMYTSKPSNDTTQKFVAYLQSKTVQQQLVTKLGYISIHDMQVVKNAAGQVTQR